MHLNVNQLDGVVKGNYKQLERVAKYLKENEKNLIPIIENLTLDQYKDKYHTLNL